MSFTATGFARRVNGFVALLVMAAFALAGWKIANRPTAPNFATVALLPASSASAALRISPLAAAPSQPPVPQQRSPDGSFSFDARFVSSAPGQAVHAVSAVELDDGSLRAVWFSGSREGAGDVAIKTAVMNAASLNWSEEKTLFDRRQIQQGLWRYVKKLGNPVIARMPDRSLMVWMVNVSVGGWAGSSITWLRSTDDGISWSAPQRLVTSPFLNISTLVKGAPFFYQDGQIGLPVYHEFVNKFAEILRINPQGQVLDKIRIPGSQTSLQPVVLVSGERRAQMYMRSSTSTGVMMSETEDAGASWSATHDTPWPNPDSALAGTLTAMGRQWLALNPTSKDRETLALVQAGAAGTFDGASAMIIEASSKSSSRLPISDYERLLGDELKAQGASQEQIQAYVASAKRQLCGAESCSQEFSYPYLLQSRDGYLHLLYTWHRSRIKHVRLDPSQLIHPDVSLPVTSHAAPAAY